ncbi:MAG: hypothetical protein JWO46_1590 [Nocardioidaceae bacterium]|nr:hypothetical protein [Nocardioidaceae bacterium]
MATPGEGRSRRDLLLVAATVVLWLVALEWAWLSIHTYLGTDLTGEDAHAYWLTAHGDALYGRPAGSEDAFLYSPLFAQLVHLPAKLPFPAFATLVSLVEAASFGWLLRPLGVRWGVPAFLFCLQAIFIGNIFGLLAVTAVLGVGAGGWWAIGSLTKVTPGLAGFGYLLGAREWRRLGWALGVTAVLALASYALAPGDWRDWVHFLRDAHTDLGVRVRTAAALLLAVLAGVLRRPWLVAVALALASPNLGGAPALTVLAAVPRLWAVRRTVTPGADGAGVA